MNVHIQNRIIEGLRACDSFQLKEILDFVEYLTSKSKEQELKRDHIDGLFGKYRDRLSSSKKFAQLKQTEKDIEARKWKTR